ncbi:MAG: hypothetical protein G01um101448_589 [Parcubacteria group bacterium Gr01-1014_48]|nr:MAG: hypothetical protein Greene041614_679 [Parcubacteria group bacterium Greene0416_14]TSC73748.1 MAG: hypothetical protein G01um101448_589 [Parcubacteria group bacterium Gr01-1014_48]TSD01365.1 MAG: hypothetical protein Greene101415_300 [Parcubacteria group bacterium Greene1014_15]TSD06794.1 MAG: hypothetical protein Greene07144_1094 [Parcubacteria group bacterium Greene0714_4]
MSLEEIETAALDDSISDEAFFEMLLKYWGEMDIKDRELETVCDINSPEFLQREQEIVRLRTIIENERPAIPTMLLQVFKQHANCYRANAEQ